MSACRGMQGLVHRMLSLADQNTWRKATQPRTHATARFSSACRATPVGASARFAMSGACRVEGSETSLSDVRGDQSREQVGCFLRSPVVRPWCGERRLPADDVEKRLLWRWSSWPRNDGSARGSGILTGRTRPLHAGAAPLELCGRSFASFRRFWAVAAKVNSSFEPSGPLSRSLPRPRIRFR